MTCLRSPSEVVAEVGPNYQVNTTLSEFSFRPGKVRKFSEG